MYLLYKPISVDAPRFPQHYAPSCALCLVRGKRRRYGIPLIFIYFPALFVFFSFFFADEFNLQPSFLGSPLNYTGGLIACSGAKKQTMFPQRALLGDAVAQRRCLTLSRFAVSRPSCTLSSTLSDFIAGLFHTAQAPCNKHVHVGSGYTGTLLHTSTHTQTHICACACIPSPLASLREWPLA